MPSTPPALVAVAHGSRDPRAGATVAGLMKLVCGRRPELDVRLAFLGLNTPRLADALAGVAQDGHHHAVVVPLLLANAFHARVDIPGAVARTAHRHPRLRLRVAQGLGDDARLARLALRRLARVAGPLEDPDLGVVLAATGSSRPSANAAVERLAAGWARRWGWRSGVAGFVTATPRVSEAIARLRHADTRRIAVAGWFLAPGLLFDQVTRQVAAIDPDIPIAGPLGADETIASVVLDRYRAGVSQLASVRQQAS